jgi:TM2 domain-containing membrane protein YozV
VTANTFAIPGNSLTNSNLEKEENTMAKSEKGFVPTLLFCFFLGTFGVHRFYVGKIGTGILMIITLGGLGIWTLIDFILIVCSKFKDKDGLYIQP